MKETISLFVKTLMKREEKGVIKVKRNTFLRSVSKSVSVEPVLYDYLNGYVIVEDERNVKFEIVELNSPYIKLASIDNVIIAFDCSKKNEAGEWDIINYQSKYVITKTLSSFLNNKIWAWLDRKRRFWVEELYEKS